MKRAGLLGAAILVAAAFAAAAIPTLAAGKTHVYAVQLSIYVDRSEGKIKGEVSSEAPSFFCEESAVRLMKEEPGKDRKVATYRPTFLGRFGFRSTPKLRGSKVYVEVLKYHLPQRPVICLAARSRAVTAP
ncbi:MAG TPA: hypothetical protein VGF09_00880 [Solirubrobacterales bacterium]|jgi:hypothetical protein